MDVNKGFNFIKLNSTANKLNVAKQEQVLLKEEQIVQEKPALSSFDMSKAIEKIINAKIAKKEFAEQTVEIDLNKAAGKLQEQSLLKYSKAEEIKGSIVRLYRPEDKINLIG